MSASKIQLSARYSGLAAQAEAYAAQRQWSKGIAVYQVLLDEFPQDAHALLQLSYLYSLDGHYRIARDYALRAHAAEPSHPRIVAELISRLRTFNEGEALLGCLQRLGPASRLPIPLLLAFAAQLTYLNLPELALELLDEAKRADPDYPPALLSRGHVLIFLGRFFEAEADLKHALRRAPEIAQGWWLLSQVRKQNAVDNHVGNLRAELNKPEQSLERTALLGFALHKELDDLGEYAQAWDALMVACRAKRSQLQYRPEVIGNVFTALRALPQSESTQLATDEPTPIFIVGMHRSGTTLLEQLLSAHSQVRGLGELYDFTSAMRYVTNHHCKGVIDQMIVERAREADLFEAGRHYLNSLAWRLQGKPFFTDKLPSNFLNLGFIATALPQAKILHMVRDPVETCFSNLRELFSDANPYSYDMAELADYFQQYHRLMRHWHTLFPGRIFDVDYACLLTRPEAILREICDFCGLTFQPYMLDPNAHKQSVVTASAVQVRGGIVRRAQPKWAPYAQWLQPMIEPLQTLVE